KSRIIPRNEFRSRFSKRTPHAYGQAGVATFLAGVPAAAAAAETRAAWHLPLVLLRGVRVPAVPAAADHVAVRRRDHLGRVAVARVRAGVPLHATAHSGRTQPRGDDHDRARA